MSGQGLIAGKPVSEWRLVCCVTYKGEGFLALSSLIGGCLTSHPFIQKMFALFLLVPVVWSFGLGLLISVTSLNFLGRKKPKLGKNNLACFLGICLGVCIWMMLMGSIQVLGTSANNMDGFPVLLLKIFLFALTPIASLPALMAYGPGTK